MEKVTIACFPIEAFRLQEMKKTCLYYTLKLYVEKSERKETTITL